MSMLTLHGYFRYRDGKFGLTKLSRKWCLGESPYSLNNQLRYLNEIFWDEMNYLEEYLRTGQGLEVHEDYYTEEQWDWYQLGQYDQAKLAARSASNMIPTPRDPAEMLDIGGSHGIYSVELCKKHPTLRATILDLAQAVEKARPILEESNMGDRIRFWIGNALTDDFGENRYDLILMSNLAHHFSSEQNTAVAQRAAKALKTGGYFIIQDFVRREPSSRMDEMGLALDMYFNLTSTAGTWSLDEMKGFQEKAGLTHYKVNRFMEMPSLVQVCAKKE
jgi:SAM-dependent methyltransferase